MNSRATIASYDSGMLSCVASELLETFDKLCTGQVEFRQVEASELRGLNHGWYEQSGSALRGFGYRLLADVQSSMPMPDDQSPTFQRLALSADGETCVSLSHIVRRQPLRLRDLLRTGSWDRGQFEILLLTEFEDGSFCRTTTLPFVYEAEPGFTVQHLPPRLSIHSVVLRHKQLLQRCQRDNATRPKPMLGLDAVIACLQHSQVRKAEARRARGAFTEAELWRLGHKQQLTGHLVAEMKKLRGQSMRTSG